MVKFTFVPLVIFALASLLTWAVGRYLALGQAQRAAAASRPRSRPYGTELPKALRRG